ncbi:MAG: DUF2807 domain-containing protein, partial [Bacteroidota bacterium]
MKKSIFFALLLLVSILGNLQADSSNERIAPFDELILSGNIDVLLVKGDVEAVDIKSEAEKVSISVNSGVLKVKRKKPLKIKSYKQRPIQVVITYQVLRRVKAASGAEVTNRATLTGDQLVLDFNSGAHGDFVVDLGDLEIKVSEG